MKYADLHLHTIYSDGTFTPEELVKQASKQGLSAIAVVDHDTVEGIDSTMEAAKTQGIEVIPGIELTAEWDGLEIHILGYLIDYKNKKLLERLEILAENRVERIYKIADKLKSIGIKLDPDSVFEISEEGTVGRLHVARAMVKEGIVSTTGEAFQKYLGDNGPAYVCGFRFTPQEAIKLLKDAGGVPVLAHPYVLRRDDLIPLFVDYGLMGLEIYYPEHTQSMINLYLDMASQYHLLITGGSDCHGKAKPEVKIGIIKLPYQFVEDLKNSKSKIL